MSRKLGKKHPQYVGTKGLERLKRERYYWNHKRRLWDTYIVQNLLTHNSLRDVYWNPQCGVACPKGIFKTLTPAKQKRYAKLERYYYRASTGR